MNETETPKKKRLRVESKLAKATLLCAKLTMSLAQALQDAGMNADVRLEELCKDKKFIRRMAQVFRRRYLLRRTKDRFTMLDEPPGRAYETRALGGPFIEMVRREFPDSDKWVLNNLPGIALRLPSYCETKHCSGAPKDTPLEREFAIWEVLQRMQSSEIGRVLRAKGWSNAYFYDLVRVREWNVPFPLFALGSAFSDDCDALLAGMKLHHSSRRNGWMNPGDRLLVWRKKKGE